MNLLKNNNDEFVVTRTINSVLYHVVVPLTINVGKLYEYNTMSNDNFIKLSKLFKQYSR